MPAMPINATVAPRAVRTAYIFDDIRTRRVLALLGDSPSWILDPAELARTINHPRRERRGTWSLARSLPLAVYDPLIERRIGCVWFYRESTRFRVPLE